jgi:hypothetical protein
MKMRIDLRAVLADPLHAVRIILYVVCATIVLGPLQQFFLMKIGCGEPVVALTPGLTPVQPPVLAGGVEVREGLLQFNGATARGLWNGTITSVMMSMVFAYLVGPALLVWGLRARGRYRMKDPAAPGATKIAVALAVGGFSVVSLLPSLGLAYRSTATYESMVADNAASEELDSMSTTLSLMARKAQVAYFVAGEPWQLSGSWQLSDGSKQPALSIVQLIEPGVDAMITDSRHAVIDGRSYELAVVRADSLILRGQVAPAHPPQSGGAATDNGVGRSVTFGVTPYLLTMTYSQ